MLYPTLSDLTKKVGNRYLLVNEVAHRARKIAKKAYIENERLPEKPVKMAILELSEGLAMNAEELEAKAAEAERAEKEAEKKARDEKEAAAEKDAEGENA